MSEATSTLPPPAARPPLTLERFDLDAHPDGDLLRLCASLGRMRSATVALEDAIEHTAAFTIEGRRMKEMSL